MDNSGGTNPYMRRQSHKRTFGDMSASHRDDSPDSLFVPDDHYDDEHSSRRRRLQLELPQIHSRYIGDGLDFRRPVRSAASQSDAVNGGSGPAPVIDLTDEDGTGESQASDSTNASAPTHAESSRAQRPPRFGRNLLGSTTPVDEAEHDTSNLPGSSFLALPPRRSRPQVSGLRRPARPPSPPRDMDDIEFLEARPLTRPSLSSRQPTPAAPHRGRGPRSVTPYPSGVGEPIDLTEDTEDDVVLLNTRSREGTGSNLDRPAATAGIGTRNHDDIRGYGHMGHLANVLRTHGAELGGRLMNRLSNIAGLDGELRAQQQAFEHFDHNHNHYNQHRAAHHHHHNYQGPRRVRAHMDGHNLHVDFPGHARGVGAMPAGMPVMMDYDMTGFDMGLGGNRPLTPKYSPPPEPEEGFTRSPEEDEVVVCPNCGDELAMGDTDAKQKIWVVKTCGHAYCGDCAINRSKAKSAKGKGKAPVTDARLPPPFKNCVVEGCGKPAGSKSMIAVYLGS